MNLVGLGMVMALAMTLVGGCAPSTVVNPPDAAVRPPAVEGPTNFASPDDLLKRYPTMRRQQL